MIRTIDNSPSAKMLGDSSRPERWYRRMGKDKKTTKCEKVVKM